MTPADIDYVRVRDGLRHRKWIFPALTYGYGDGVEAEKHYYVVGHYPFAVSFTVHTGRYPSGYGVTARPSGSDVSRHRHTGKGNTACAALDGAACESDGSICDAHEWYEAQPKDNDGFVSDDEIFAMLRAYYVASGGDPEDTVKEEPPMRPTRPHYREDYVRDAEQNVKDVILAAMKAALDDCGVHGIAQDVVPDLMRYGLFREAAAVATALDAFYAARDRAMEKP
jgi:hypothetical protein